jgi:predicted lactoylglutathione lyase
MAKQIFINLAVNNLQKSIDFYTALGFTNNPQFSDDTAKCMVWSENIFVMLLTHEKFSFQPGFTNLSFRNRCLQPGLPFRRDKLCAEWRNV